MEILSHTEKTLKKGPAHRPFLDPKTVPKMGPRAAQNWIPFWTHFCPKFGPLLEVFWEPSGPPDWPRRGLEEPKRAKGALRNQEDDYKKVVFA